MSVNNKEQIEALYREIAQGNESAYEWICLWQDHCHKVDDILDREIEHPDEIIKAFLQCEALYSHSFYSEYKHRLYPVIFLAANAYADSIQMKYTLPEVADIIRSNGNEVLILVAAICTPLGVDVWNNTRNISQKIREFSYKSQH